MVSRIIITIIMTLVGVLPAMSQETPAVPQEITSDSFCTPDILKFLSELGISGGDVESCALEFMNKYAGDIKDILSGATPMIATPEGLMSISALAAGLMVKNPLLKAGALGLGAMTAYDTLQHQSTEPPTDSINPPQESVEKAAQPVKPVETNQDTDPQKSSGFFNTVTMDE